MSDEFGILMNAPKATLILLMTPSLTVGLVLMFIVYRLTKLLGSRFLDVQDRQAAAFEKIASTVETMKAGLDNSTKSTDDIRITLAAMGEKLNNIYEHINRADK